MNNLQDEVTELRKLLSKGVALVEDFLPNIRHCVLQDYARLNDFLLQTKAKGIEAEKKR